MNISDDKMKNFQKLMFKIIIITNIFMVAYYISILLQLNNLRELFVRNNIKRKITVYYPIFDKGKPCPRNHYKEDDIINLIPLAKLGDCDSLAVLLRYTFDLKNSGEFLDFSRLQKEYQAAGCKGLPCISSFEIKN